MSDANGCITRVAPGPGIGCPKTAPSLNYTWGEWRHGINLIGVDGFALHNLRITETGGDAVQIAVRAAAPFASSFGFEASPKKRG